MRGITISEDRLKFFQAVRVENGQSPVFQPRDALPNLQQALNFRGGKLLTAGRLNRERKIKPIFAGTDDLQLRRYPFDAARDMLEPATDGNLPFLLQLRKITSEKAQDRVLASQQILAGRGWSR